MKNTYYTLIVICFLSFTSCKISSQYDTAGFIGEYEYLYVVSNGNEKTRLILKEDGSYFYFLEYSTVYPSLCYNPPCKSKGTWEIRGKNVILNSFLRNIKIEDYREQIRLYDYHHDSIQVEILNLSDGSPVKGAILTLYGENDILLPINFKNPIETNEKGLAIFPVQSVKEIGYPAGSCIEGMYRISRPQKGYYYRIYYQDCIPKVFDNKKLEVRGDTLIMSEKMVTDYHKGGKKTYNTFKHEYIKVDNVSD